MEDWCAAGVWIWERATAAQNFAAGGGLEEEFAAEWAFVRGLQEHERAAAATGCFTSPGAARKYLAWGRKPSG